MAMKMHIHRSRNDVVILQGGVEEEKDDGEAVSPTSLRYRPTLDSENKDPTPPPPLPGGGGGVNPDQGFRARLEHFAKVVFGSCGNAMEAASFFVQGQGCRWPSTDTGHVTPPRDAKPPLSIAEELRKLALKDERYAQPAPFRSADIPKFLGEEAVYSFEDDNISAISQHTLEEMARKGILHPMCRRSSNNSNHSPPSPTRTTSISTNSSKEQKKSDEDRDDL